MWHTQSAYCVLYNPTITAIGLMTVEMAEQVTRIGDSRDAYKMLFGRPRGKNLLGRPRRRRDLEKKVRDRAH
jgi:hypothetical protein